MLSLLMVIGIEIVMMVRIFFVFGKQMAFVARNKDFPPYKRSFIWNFSKGASEYSLLMYQEQISDK